MRNTCELMSSSEVAYRARQIESLLKDKDGSRTQKPDFAVVICPWLEEWDPINNTSFTRNGFCSACGQTGHELAADVINPVTGKVQRIDYRPYVRAYESWSAQSLINMYNDLCSRFYMKSRLDGGFYARQARLCFIVDLITDMAERGNETAIAWLEL